MRDTFEVKVEERLGDEGFPEFMSADSVKRRAPQFVVWRLINDVWVRLKDRTVLVDVSHNRTLSALCISIRYDKYCGLRVFFSKIDR